jgi:hypothetical protein
MPWITLDNLGSENPSIYHETLAELEHDSDRAPGIVGAALLEESLSALLKSRACRNDRRIVVGSTLDRDNGRRQLARCRVHIADRGFQIVKHCRRLRLRLDRFWCSKRTSCEPDKICQTRRVCVFPRNSERRKAPTKVRKRESRRAGWRDRCNLSRAASRRIRLAPRALSVKADRRRSVFVSAVSFGPSLGRNFDLVCARPRPFGHRGAAIRQCWPPIPLAWLLMLR